MTRTRLRTGALGEQLAAERLVALGYEILGRNVRTRFGEIDLIARDADALVFVEVKTGRLGASRGPARPVHAVGPRKQLQLRRLARAWLAEGHSIGAAEIRFDVVGVTL